MDQTPPKTAGLEIDPTQLRFLTPEMCRIHLGHLGALHVTIINEGIYGGVYAAYDFPVAHPDQYISLMQTMGEKDQEIGIIRDLSDFPESDALLVRQALARRYFVHTILSIKEIGWKFGLVAFEVETDKGLVNFFMRWSQDRAVDYGKEGKVIIDLEGNRFLIPDLEKLDAAEREHFQRYIYW